MNISNETLKDLCWIGLGTATAGLTQIGIENWHPHDIMTKKLAMIGLLFSMMSAYNLSNQKLFEIENIITGVGYRSLKYLLIFNIFYKAIGLGCKSSRDLRNGDPWKVTCGYAVSLTVIGYLLLDSIYTQHMQEFYYNLLKQYWAKA